VPYAFLFRRTQRPLTLVFFDDSFPEANLDPLVFRPLDLPETILRSVGIPPPSFESSPPAHLFAAPPNRGHSYDRRVMILSHSCLPSLPSPVYHAPPRNSPLGKYPPLLAASILPRLSLTIVPNNRFVYPQLTPIHFPTIIHPPSNQFLR